MPDSSGMAPTALSAVDCQEQAGRQEPQLTGPAS
jgi:hypothetical protein